MTSDHSIIKQIKLSDYLQIDFESQTDRLMFRLTGNLDKNKSTLDELCLYSIESTEKNRYEVLIDTRYLSNDFNLNDIHSQHDLVQFIGYKDPTEEEEYSHKFRALSFRILKRTSIRNYYLCIDTLNEYLKTK